MPEYKQQNIADELRRRIQSGELSGKLPLSAELSAEFQVNFKTMNKALNRLVSEGLLARKRGSGTFVRSCSDCGENKVVEVLFEGYETILNHPYWGAVWGGVMKTLTDNGFQVLLNNLESDPATGILKLDGCRFTASAGKVLIGVGETRLIRLLQETATAPFVSVCDEVEDSDVLAVYVDDRKAIGDMVEWLWNEKRREIAFIGVACSYTNAKLANRFRAYLDALQQYRQIDPQLIADVRLLAENGYSAMKRLLACRRPDAVIVSGNHLIPGVAKALREAKLNIPRDIRIAGCDGVDPHVDFPVPTVRIDRFLLGERAVELLLAQMHAPRSRGERRVRVESVFDPEGFSRA